MPVDSAEFRRILGHWSSGVAIVSSRTPAGEPCGLTANAVTSVSLEPPLVLACIERASVTRTCIETSGIFAINVLAQADERLARRFAADQLEEKFHGVAYHEAMTGAPVLDDALAWIDCRVHTALPTGDHTIFVGAVLGGDAREGEPLLYYRSGYARLEP